MFAVSDADIMVLTETNHNNELYVNHPAITKLEDGTKTFRDMRRRIMNGKEIGLYYTIPSKQKGNGVVFLSKPGFKLYPILEAIASSRVAAVMVQKFSKDANDKIFKFIVIGTYWKHGHHEETRQEFNFLIKNIHQYYKEIKIILAGDFNQTRSQVERVQLETNL